jgi:hypothetical protein
MFREFECGCMHSHVQGLVRVCETHRPHKSKVARGIEGSLMSLPLGKLPKVIKRYPANGSMPSVWTGR